MTGSPLGGGFAKAPAPQAYFDLYWGVSREYLQQRSMRTMNEFQKQYAAQISELVAAANRLAELGFVTSQGGNLSLRAAENVILITPTKVAKAEVAFDDICAIDMEGKVIHTSNGRKPTGEWPFHLRIMQKRPDVKGIIHAHPPILTGFAITGSDLMQRAYLPEPVIEVGPMIMVPYALPLSDELAMQFDACIARSNGFLMESHGCVMVSPDGLKRCLEMMEMMEAQGKSMVVAKVMGGLRSMDSAHVDELEQVLKARNLPMPGLPGAVEKLSDIFVCES